MKYTFATILLLLNVSAFAQKLPVLKPSETLGRFEYSVEEGRIWEKAIGLYDYGEYDRLEEAVKTLVDSIEMGYGPLTEGPGCSWYCGGGPYKVTASSFLASQDSLYIPGNAHDFNVLKPWIPAGNPIGSKLNFHFEPRSPRLHTIIVYNGHLKNMDLWKKNARAKKLKLYIDGTPKAILELDDDPTAQAFRIDPVQSVTEGKDMVLTLEVLEVYPGTKYTDLAIAEVNFDGLDVHCFAAGTMISMKDGSDKAIEAIRPGEEVLCTNSPRLILTTAKVARVVTARHTLKKLTFKGITILVTDDHPFMTEKKEWASLNPEKSNSNYNQDYPVTQLEIGDKVWWAPEQEWVALTSIADTDAPQSSYTLELENGSNFIANGLMVKTESVIVPEQ